MRGPLWALGIACAACAGDVVIELPPLAPATKAWLLARVSPEGDVHVDAADASSAAIRFDAPSAPTGLELRALEQDLSELGFAAGPLVEAPDPSQAAVLPAGARFTARVDRSGALEPWREGAGLPEVDAFRTSIATPCFDLTPEVSHVPGPDELYWAVQLSTGDVLFGGEGRAFLFGAEGDPRELRYDGATGAGRFNAAFVDARDRVWIGADQGALWRGEIVGDALALTQRIATSTSVGMIAAIAGDPTSPESETFAAALDGRLLRAAGARWETVDALPLEHPQRATIAWRGPGALLLAIEQDPRLHLIRGGRLAAPVLADTSNIGLTGLGPVSSTTIAVAGAGGELSLYADRLIPLGQAAITLDVRCFAPLPRGFLYGGSSGFIGQWDREVGFCPVEQPIAPRTVRGLYPQQGGVLVLGDLDISGRRPFVRLRLRPVR